MIPCKDGTTAHHWFIEIPAGPLSNGICQRCKTNRQFKNYLDVRQITVEGERDPSREPYSWRGAGGSIKQHDTNNMA